jgi:hypothetical protein
VTSSQLLLDHDNADEAIPRKRRLNYETDQPKQARSSMYANTPQVRLTSAVSQQVGEANDNVKASNDLQSLLQRVKKDYELL